MPGPAREVLASVGRYRIGRARAADVPRLAAIERAAGELLRGHAPDRVLMETTDAGELDAARSAGDGVGRGVVGARPRRPDERRRAPRSVGVERLPALCLRPGRRTSGAADGRAGGGTCRGKSCWKALGTRGCRFNDPTRTSDGVSKFVVITGSAAGSMKAQLKAKGASLPPLHLPLTIPVVAQLESANGHCWETRHDADGLLHDDARQFRALGD